MTDDDRLDSLAERLRAARRAAQRDDDDMWGTVPRMSSAEKDRYVVVDDDDDDEPHTPVDAYEVVFETEGDSDPKSMDELIGELPMNDDGTIDYEACGFNASPGGGVPHSDAEPASGASGSDDKLDNGNIQHTCPYSRKRK